MCSQCADRDPGRRFAIDGKTDVLCSSCVRESIQIAWAHEQVRRIHRAAHGHDAPCPVCAEDLDVVRWRAEAELDEAVARIPWPPA